MQRFLVDLMLMRLGRWLRLLGQDVAHPKGESDDELLLQAKKESRTIITRDKGLFQACPGAGAKVPAHPVLDNFRSAPGDGRSGRAPAT